MTAGREWYLLYIRIWCRWLSIPHFPSPPLLDHPRKLLIANLVSGFAEQRVREQAQLKGTKRNKWKNFICLESTNTSRVRYYSLSGASSHLLDTKPLLYDGNRTYQVTTTCPSRPIQYLSSNHDLPFSSHPFSLLSVVDGPIP